MQDAIATVLKSNTDKLVEASPFFSLLIDESTDVSNHENLVVYVKLLNEFKPELHFLENINVRDGKAETITTAVNLLMEKRNLHKDKITGFGSDGASVMTGKNNGVSKYDEKKSLDTNNLTLLVCITFLVSCITRIR